MIPNGIDTPIRKNCRTAIFISSIDERLQKIDLKICDLNKDINHELSHFNKKWALFLNI